MVRKSFARRAREPLVRWNNTYRDAIQSLLGTNPSAEEIVAAHPNAHKMGNASVQTCGGTFYDSFARKGRDPFTSIRTINAAYKRAKKTALFRGGCLTVFKCNPEDVVLETVLQHAKAGVNVLQNFHGQNDTRMMGMVAAAAKIAREEHGYDIVAQGTICVEDNVNVTIESCLETARELIKSGHKGFYLKCASGRIKAHFMRELVGRLMDEFPEQSVDMHVHHLYGEALPAYVAGIEAAVARGKSIGADVLHPAIAGNTAQPSILDLYDLLINHHDPKVRENAPKIDYEAIEADTKLLQELRLRYSHVETKYNPRLLAAMYNARVPGGASATLRAIPGLEKNLAAALGTNDWDEIQIAIYEMQAKILKRLGDPTQVTPYALLTTTEAAFAVLRERQGKDPLSDITADTVDYLVGRLGKVPESADPQLIELALKKAGLSETIKLLTPDQFQDGMGRAEAKLLEKLRSLDAKPVLERIEKLTGRIEEARKKLLISLSEENAHEISKARAELQADEQVLDQILKNTSADYNITREEILYVATLRDNSDQERGLKFVLAGRDGTREEQAIPELPIAKYLPGGKGAGADGSLSKGWIKITGAEHLDSTMIDAIGGAAGFEALSQHILTLYRAFKPANLPQQEVPDCFPKLHVLRQQQAKDAIEEIKRRVYAAYSDSAPPNQQIALLNKVIDGLCTARGVNSSEPTDVFTPFDRRKFPAFARCGSKKPYTNPPYNRLRRFSF